MTIYHASIRRATPARIVAIAVIAVLSIGLMAMRLSHRDNNVRVSAGAKAGQLQMHSCSYQTESGKQSADCGTFIVPENRTNPHSRLIALRVTRVRAQTHHPGAPIFYMQGGPGITNMQFPMASRFTPNHDVVVLGYRGVDSSTKLDCPEVTSALTGTRDLLAKSTLHAYSAAYHACAQRLNHDGVDLLGYNSVERVDDFEAARQSLGYGPIDLISESAGTRTAMIYAWRYPHSINRSVMLAVNPPGHYLYNGPMTDQQIQHYSQLCAADASCRSRTSDLAATMQSLSRNLPDRWGPFAIKAGNVKLATFFGLMDATFEASPLSAPQTIGAWLSAAHGDKSGLWLQSVFADLSIPSSHVWGDVPATGQLDAAANRAYYAAGGDHGTILGNAFTDHLWGAGGLSSNWPHSPEVDKYTTLRPTNVPTLLISGDVDFATPAPFATEMLPSLRDGHQVVLHNLGHTEDTWNYDKAGMRKLIDTYLLTGRLDPSAYNQRAMDLHASPTQGMIAKIVIASLGGLAALAVSTMIWLPLRQRRRGSVGRKTGVFVRTLLAPLSGLGGWAAAVLLMLTVWPAMSIADQKLVIVSVGAPVAVLVYAAWTNGNWTASVRHAGLCAAIGGAAIGAWLGQHAGPGMLGALTATLGATLGANLTLLVRDCLSGTPVDTAPATSPAPVESVGVH